MAGLGHLVELARVLGFGVYDGYGYRLRARVFYSGTDNILGVWRRAEEHCCWPAPPTGCGGAGLAGEREAQVGRVVVDGE